MTLKEKITNELKKYGDPNMDKLLKYMDENGYYSCHCSSHNSWYGGGAEHMWATFLFAKYLRDSQEKDPLIEKYATDRKLAFVCLLHDICDIRNVRVYDHDNNEDVSHRHGQKSYWILKNHNVGSEIERLVILNHQHHTKCHFKNPNDTDEYNTLMGLQSKADCLSAGTAWNTKRFLNNETQHRGEHLEHKGHIWAVAMDRSLQSGWCHAYMDENYELREYRNYAMSTAQWKNIIPIDIDDSAIRVQLDNTLDVITAAHSYTLNTGKRLCLVAGISEDIPNDNEDRLRQGNYDEQEILICSNTLLSFYSSVKRNKKGEHRYEFTMRDNIKQEYLKHPSCIYLPNVLMIRDGRKRGLPFVEPWETDLLLIPGKRFEMFAILADSLNI